VAADVEEEMIWQARPDLWGIIWYLGHGDVFKVMLERVGLPMDPYQINVIEDYPNNIPQHGKQQPLQPQWDT
jgi:hypothetical protein